MATMDGASREGDASRDAAQGAHEELALGADVEQAGLEAEAHGEARQDERRGADERVDQAARAQQCALRPAPGRPLPRAMGRGCQ